MKKLFITLFALLFLCQPLRADDDAKAVSVRLKVSVSAILEILKDKGMKKEVKKDKVMGVVTPFFDLSLMAKLVLGKKHWPKLSKDQRKTFTDLFIKQLQASYFDKMDLMSDETVEYGEPVRLKTKFRVLTHVISKDQRIEIAYKFYKNKKASDPKEAWRVYDVEIEGISIVKSYGSQYDQFLKDGAIKGLFIKMEEKIKGFNETPKKKDGPKPDAKEEPKPDKEE
ncbi:phospholipid-binding protein MlaC [Elusimicrobiota bacterium]